MIINISISWSDRNYQSWKVAGQWCRKVKRISLSHPNCYLNNLGLKPALRSSSSANRSQFSLEFNFLHYFRIALRFISLCKTKTTNKCKTFRKKDNTTKTVGFVTYKQPILLYSLYLNIVTTVLYIRWTNIR